MSVVESDRIDIAGLVGCRRPTIVLPCSTLSTATVRDVEAIVAHELAHVRRHDYAANLWQVLIETVLFFHPAIWWLSRQVRVEREHCCDDLATAVHDAYPLPYAEALVRLEHPRTVARQRTPSAWGGHLASRVRRLTATSNQAAGGTSCWAPTALFNLAALSLLWAVRTTGGVGAFMSATWSHASMDIDWTTLMFGAGLGLLLGMRHACEPDHLIAVSTLISGERSAARATGLGVSWGLGHTCSLFAVGASLAIVHRQLPAHVSELFELSVSLMLVGLGARAIALARRQGTSGPSHVHTHTHGALSHQHRGVVDHMHVGEWSLARRPLLVGIVHGLAGSGALTALVMANLPTMPAQVSYIVVFGAGSTIGMATLSACAGWPLARLVQRPVTIAALSCVSGALSIAYGLLSGSPLIWRWFS